MNRLAEAVCAVTHMAPIPLVPNEGKRNCRSCSNTISAQRLSQYGRIEDIPYGGVLCLVGSSPWGGR